MAFELKQVVPWGRNFYEYQRMFSLEEHHARARILGCADGPASFNAEATVRNWQITSLDPLYQFDCQSIRDRITETKDAVMAQTRANQEQFRWTLFTSPDALLESRIQAMERFLEDFETGLSEGRYKCGTLPVTPFKSASFDLALVSHFLFLYSEIHDLEFHLKAITELMRVAREVRIFPLLDLSARRSIHLSKVVNELSNKFEINIRKVDYEFQIGGNEMLQILPKPH